MTGLSLASASFGIADDDRGTAHDDDVSADVVRGLHADAVRLHKSELFFVLPTLVLAVVAAGAAIMLPRQMSFLWILAAPLILRVGQWSIVWWRLRTQDPFEHFHRERLDDLDQASGVADLQARLSAKKPIATIGLIAAITLVAAAQLVVAGLEASVAAAGLVKAAAREGEWWRLLTASYLHGHLYHLAGNLTALAVLGETIEAYDRRLRVPMVYLAGVIGGSLLSLLLVAGTGIGASGGVLGLAGYLLVLAHRRRGDGSRWLRKRPIGVLAFAAIFGAVGFLFVDNAAHLGGVIAGVLVGLLCAPGQTGEAGADATPALDLAGWTAVVILAAGAAFTLSKLLV